jgi:hypothetical protein
MDLKETEWKSVDLVHLVQDRDQCWALVNRIMNYWVQLGSVKYWEFLH